MNKNTENTDQTETGSMTTVKTIYARAALLLLALNFCLTGYVVLSMSQATQAQLDGVASSSSQQVPAQLGLKREKSFPTPETRQAN